MRFERGLSQAPEEVQVVDDTGSVRRGINWHLTPDELHQVEDGYRCLHCMQVFDQAFPEKCIVCGFHVRAQQTFELSRQFIGDASPDPRRYDPIMEERELEAWKPKSGIWLPKGYDQGGALA